jgi:molecular chaperone GrpE
MNKSFKFIDLKKEDSNDIFYTINNNKDEEVGSAHISKDETTKIDFSFTAELKNKEKEELLMEFCTHIAELNLSFPYLFTNFEVDKKFLEKNGFKVESDGSFFYDFAQVEKENEEKHEHKHECSCKEKEKHINELNKLIEQKEKTILTLKSQLEDFNRDYVTKLTTKMNEANELLKTKEKELIEKKDEEIKEIKKYAISKDAGKLIIVINQFERALAFTPKDPVVQNYQNGFKMFLNMFKNALNEMGIEEIVIEKGVEFDPNIMEVIDHVDGGEMPSNHVVEVVSNAYKLHDKLIQVATVKVAE